MFLTDTFVPKIGDTELHHHHPYLPDFCYIVIRDSAYRYLIVFKTFSHNYFTVVVVW